MSKNHALTIIDAVTEERLIEFGIPERTIRHARSVGTFAGAWYDPIKSLCEKHGVYCPTSAFRWKSPGAKKCGTDADTIQDEGRDCVPKDNRPMPSKADSHNMLGAAE